MCLHIPSEVGHHPFALAMFFAQHGEHGDAKECYDYFYLVWGALTHCGLSGYPVAWPVA